MKTSIKYNLFLVVTLGMLALGTSALAGFTQPQGQYPINTEPPVDTSTKNQVKSGALGVKTFLGRGNAAFNQDLSIRGSIQSGQPSVTNTKVASTVTAGSNILVNGDLKSTGGYLNSATLKHTEAQPKPICNDSNGNIVFCN